MYINIKQSKSACMSEPRDNGVRIPSLDFNAQNFSDSLQWSDPISTLQNPKALLIFKRSFFKIYKMEIMS